MKPEDHPIYLAVLRSATPRQLRRLINRLPPAERKRLLDADVECDESSWEYENPLQCAHRLGRVQAIGILIESGASPRVIFAESLTALSVCTIYGLPSSVKALLDSGKHGVDDTRQTEGCTALHVAFCGRCRFFEKWDHEEEEDEEEGLGGGADDQEDDQDEDDEEDDDEGDGDDEEEDDDADEHVTEADELMEAEGGAAVPRASRSQLDCVEVLLEGGADPNARDVAGRTPLFYVENWIGEPELFSPAVATLVKAGADVNAKDDDGRTMVFAYARPRRLPVLRLLTETHGASVDVIDAEGWTPLMVACLAVASSGGDEAARSLVKGLLRASSDETRRAKCAKSGESAVDLLAPLAFRHLSPDEARPHWTEEVIRELLGSRAPVLPESAPAVLSITATLASSRQAQVDASRARWTNWRGQEMMVNLSFDHQELREAEEGVRRREARVRELEEALRARGGGTDGSGSSDEDDDDDEDEKEEEAQEEGTGAAMEE